MTEIYNTRGKVIAEFEEYEDAILCLSAMSRILKITLWTDADIREPSVAIPRGCMAYQRLGYGDIIESRP